MSRVPAEHLFSDRTKAFALAIRKSMLKTISAIPDREVSVFLSSGVDSNACLAACLCSDKVPIIHAATINGIRSQDFVSARNTAAKFGLKFVPTDIRVDEAYVKNYLKFFVQELRPDLHKNKTTIETSFIVFEMIKEVQTKYIVSGFYGDAFFATLRSLKKIWEAGNYESVHTNLAKLQVNNPDKCQDIQQLMRLEFVKRRKLDRHFVLPYVEPSFFKAVRGMDPFIDGNKPIQKAPLRYAFYPYFKANASNVYIHVAMQKGAIAVDALFEKILVNSDWNTRGLKSAKGIYNDLERRLL